MDIQPQATTQPISDDQELAKALAGVMPDAPEAPASSVPTTEDPMQFEETPAPAVAPAAVDSTTTSSLPAPTPATTPSDDLEGIKKTALVELRPLIDKVELTPEEKFDTYLMLIRSTDDSSLIGPAHAAAQSISDEKRRAEALLDIIKEIDYLSRGTQAAA